MKSATVIGVPATVAPDPQISGVATATAVSTQIVPSINPGIVRLSDAQLRSAEQYLAKLDFKSMRADQVVAVGSEAEQRLKKSLDGYMQNLDLKSAPEVFALFDRLQKGVADAQLPQLHEQIQALDQPGFLARLFSRKSLADLVREGYEKLRGVISGKTKTLADTVSKLEVELDQKNRALQGELQNLESVKDSYTLSLDDFALAVVVADNFLEQSKKLVADEEARLANSEDPREKAELSDLRNKLELLESRATNLVTSYARLPADRLAIQQIQQAGVATFQESFVTATSRFSSIKMTLIALNGAFKVKGVQLAEQRQAEMDRQLMQVRGALTKDVATTAAIAPGDHRLAEAAKIQAIIQQAQEIDQIIKSAREINRTKFAEARQQCEEHRKALALLG